MEGMLWGVAAMCVKDAIKNPYLKGRDYERNVRQVHRDVDNLKITMDHVKTSCADEDFVNGPHAPYIKRAERQLKDAYRTLRREFPRKPGLTRLLEHAATPGREMHLLDIGKEANQTARGLGDLLSEIRFAKIGKSNSDNAEPAPKSRTSSSPRRRSSSGYDMAMYEDAVSDTSSPRSSVDGVFDHRRGLIHGAEQHSSSPPSSTSSSHRSHSSRKHSSSSSSHSSSRRRHSTTSSHHRDHQRKALPPASASNRLTAILEGVASSERSLALDNLQLCIDGVLRAPDSEHEGEAMERVESAMAEVLRLQKTAGGFSEGSPVDEDLGDAVEELDEAVQGFLCAKGERETKHAVRCLEDALLDVDGALADRKRWKRRVEERRGRPGVVDEPVERKLVTSGNAQPPTRVALRRLNSGDGKRERRYSMYK